MTEAPPRQPEQEHGDRALYGVKMQLEPHQVPPGYASSAINMRFAKGVAESRKGVVFLPWMNKITGGVMQPWGTVYGIGSFLDPFNHTEYVLIAADGNVYYTSSGNVPVALTLPSGVTITTACRFVQCFNVVLLLRGPDLPVLQMTGISSGFTAITQTPAGTGTFTIPNVSRGLNAANRLFVIQEDTVMASDVQDYTRFSIFRELLINQGADDTLVNIGMFGKSTMIALKSKSIYRIDNVYGDLSATVLSAVTKRYGCIAPDTAVDMGTDFVWLSAEGIASLSLTTQNEVQASQGALAGKWPMFSDDVKPLISRINWQYAGSSQAAFADGKLYFAVPLDDAENLRHELLDGQRHPLGGLAITVTTVAGATYRWEKGSHDTSLDNGSSNYTGSRDFVAAGTTVTVNGSAGLTDGSLRRVYKGVNNAVLVFDTQAGPNGAWAGYDESDEIMVQRWHIATYLGKQRLFFMSNDGWLKLYEEAYQDQLSEPYTEVLVSGTPVYGSTLRINAGTVITSANSATNSAANWGVGGSSTPNAAVAAINLARDLANNGGFAIGSTGAWTAANTYPLGQFWGVRFYATNGVVPSYSTTASWLTITQVGTSAIETELVTRQYALPDLALQRFRQLYLDLQTWNALFSVDLIGPGVNNTINLCTDREKDRTLYYRPWNRQPFTESNVNGDFALPNRQDYSVDLSSGIYLTGGVQLDLHQEAREPFKLNFRGRACQLKLTNTRGRVRMIAARFVSKTEHEKAEAFNS